MTMIMTMTMTMNMDLNKIDRNECLSLKIEILKILNDYLNRKNQNIINGLLSLVIFLISVLTISVQIIDIYFNSIYQLIYIPK